MTKKDIAQAVAASTDVSAATAEAVIGAALDAIAASLAKGEDVRLAGFGAFETRERAARTGRNPQTGEAIQIKASYGVKVSAGSKLKAAAK